MIKNESPWYGLEAGKIDTRRVDASAKWNWFWAVMPSADAALVMQLEKFPSPVLELPKLRSLEIKFQTLVDVHVLYIRLKDGSQIELFETLCRDVMAAAELAHTETEALGLAIGRAFRWHYLLQRGRFEILPEFAQKGLIAEIEVLKRLVEDVGPKSALQAWTGPSGAPKDFELPADCIEVKARRGASRPFVEISSEFQLSDVPGRNLWLAVISVDKVVAPCGRTLSNYIDELTNIFEKTDPSVIFEWNSHLCDAGYDPLHDYSGWRWVNSPPDVYMISDGFPRIVLPVCPGVSGVTYSLSLSACRPYLKEWQNVRTRLLEDRQP